MSAEAPYSYDKYRHEYAEGRHARDEHDWYLEPAWVVELLADAELFVGEIYDRACGCGTIPKVFERRGYDVAGSDVVDRGYGTRRDFLAEPLPFMVDNIVTNPPYKHAEAFIERALGTARRKVAVIVGAKFPYSRGRYPLFIERPPSRLLFHSWRPSMPPGRALLDGTVEAKGGSVDYLWIVWDREHVGPTTCGWLGAPGGT